MNGFNELIFLGHLAAAGLILLGAARRGQTWLTALIVVCTVLMNVVVMKQMTLLGLSVTGGNVLYATVFLANNVLNEHFGRRAARSAVYVGFAAGLAVLLLMQIELFYRPDKHDEAQAHLAYFFQVQAYPRIVVASMISYLTAQLLDTWLYHRIRQWTGPERLLWLRSNVSTWISQAYDTVFFTTAALVGTIIRSWEEWIGAVLFAYLIKILCAAVQTGFLYLTTWTPLLPAGSLRQSLTGDRPSPPGL